LEASDDGSIKVFHLVIPFLEGFALGGARVPDVTFDFLEEASATSVNAEDGGRTGVVRGGEESLGEGNSAGTLFCGGLDWEAEVPEVICPAGSVVGIWDESEGVDVVFVNTVVANDGFDLGGEVPNQHLGVDLVVEKYLASGSCSKKANRVGLGGVNVDEYTDGVVFWRVNGGEPTVGGFLVDMSFTRKHRVDGTSKGARNTMDTSVDFILVGFPNISAELGDGFWGVVDIVHHGAGNGPLGGDLVGVGFDKPLLGEKWWEEKVVDPEVDGGGAKKPSSPLSVDKATSKGDKHFLWTRLVDVECVPVVGFGGLVVLLEGLDGFKVDDRNSAPLGLDVDFLDLALGILGEVNKGSLGEELEKLALASPLLHRGEGGLGFAPVLHNDTDFDRPLGNTDGAAGIVLRIPHSLAHGPGDVLGDACGGLTPPIARSDITTQKPSRVKKFLSRSRFVEIQSIVLTVAIPLFEEKRRPLAVGFCHF